MLTIFLVIYYYIYYYLRLALYCPAFQDSIRTDLSPILDQSRSPILFVKEGPRSIYFTPDCCSPSHLCNVSVFILSLLFLVLFLFFSSLFFLLLLFPPVLFFHMPPPFLTVHKRVFYLFHQNAEGLGVCVPHTEINFSSASGTKQSAMLIVASMCAHET